MDPKNIDVLFVCVHNSGRSVAAKLIFNHRAQKLGLDLKAESAGTNPAKHVNTAVANALQSFGLNASDEIPKQLSDELLENEPKVITMGCQIESDMCPALMMQNVEDWALPDPATMSESQVIPLIHEIARKVNALIQLMTTLQANIR